MGTIKRFYSRGKLMITGEYLVLKGAKSLALPTTFGQHLKIEESKGNGIITWTSLTKKGTIWFECSLKLPSFQTAKTTDKKTSDTLIKLLKNAQKLTLTPLRKDKNYLVTTSLEFERNWGLGSSSTLVNNIAEWFNIDALELFFSVFKGSGYDVACAKENSSIVYQLKKDHPPLITPQKLSPPFSDNLFFIHLNQKQDSNREIERLQHQIHSIDIKETANKITAITDTILTTSSLTEFEQQLLLHENLISKYINRNTVQQTLFPDYTKGIVKSLGAWGGDFVLTTGKQDDMMYFKNKGYNTILPFAKMIHQNSLL